MLARRIGTRLLQTRGLSRIQLSTTATSSILRKCNTPMAKKDSRQVHAIPGTSTVVPEQEISIATMVSSIYDHVKRCRPEDFTEEDKKKKPLEPRTITNSYRKFVIPLSTDIEKQKEYLSAMGNVRIGKILEDLDHMAVHVAYIHNSENGSLEGPMTLPRTIVTASVKRIDFHKEDIHSSRDIIIDGQVTYAGTSSMQISIRLFQNDENGNMVHILKADFIMVSRDPLDGTKKVRVHGLVAKTPDEAETINQAKEHFKTMSNKNEEPTNDEFRLIHRMYNKLIGRNMVNDIPVLTNSEIWMHKTKLSVTEICFPEYQNMYGKIFGGFLMRKALELAYTNAKMYCKGRVAIRSMDHIEFAKAVEIGHVLHFDSFVTYTDGKYIQVKVAASISDQNKLPELAKMNNPTLGQEARVNTNVFNFTMESMENPDVLTVVPKHYVHATTYLEGRRLLNNTLKRIIN
ncbi:hypothetical protein GCK72_017914 [Caenorhabditis remanei]|uniref:HotDog ACOT-type domain-containing protein n=1 Tax=Caenorhabditis remanei TaxID=31234 RepID=A0A6A5G8Q7_CAERE|nr:hypothetical protein GCK72_017914 [Caenorhabditis remanei]KAF1751360.1 hypothetical protein GCK72_017914 [Caenorhabditis remanei]